MVESATMFKAQSGFRSPALRHGAASGMPRRWRFALSVALA